MAYQIFSEIIKTHKTVGIDEIVEVGKSVDEIVEVEKFNPFHDDKGWFATSNGFKSYSADPNTKAGAMAIARSVAAGHGSTKNSHKQAQGSTLNANATWLKGYGRGTTNGKNTLLRVENMGGLGQASALGAQWQSQNVSGGRSLQPSPKATVQTTTAKPAAQKPTAAQQQSAQGQDSLAADVANVSLASSDKLAIQLRDGSKSTVKGVKTADDNYQERVAGKDISDTFDVRKANVNTRLGEGAIDVVAEAQGWRKSPTVTNDLETFQKAAIESGQILFRSVGAYTDGNGKYYSDIDACKEVMTNGKASLNGSGAQCYGGGLYLVGASVSSGSRQNAKTLAGSSQESFGYNRQQMMATVRKGTKIADYNTTQKLEADYQALSRTGKAKFGNDIGAYIAAKGYDAACWHIDQSPYITFYNKSALIFYGSTASR